MRIGRQFGVYVLGGALAFGLDVAVFWLLRQWGAPLWLANGVARLAGAALAYGFHHLWTFHQSADKAAWGASAWRYAVQWMAATALSIGLLQAAVGFFEQDVHAKILVEAVLLVGNFLLARHWVYRKNGNHWP